MFRFLSLVLLAVCLVVSRSSVQAQDFIRGDADANGVVNVQDAVFILNFLYLGGPAALPPADRLDANDNEYITVVDAYRVIEFLFCPVDPIPAPFPTPGPDPDDDVGTFGTANPGYRIILKVASVTDSSALIEVHITQPEPIANLQGILDFGEGLTPAAPFFEPVAIPAGDPVSFVEGNRAYFAIYSPLECAPAVFQAGTEQLAGYLHFTHDGSVICPEITMLPEATFGGFNARATMGTSGFFEHHPVQEYRACPVDLIRNGDFEDPFHVVGDDDVPSLWQVFETFSGGPTELSVVSDVGDNGPGGPGSHAVNFLRDLDNASGDWTSIEHVVGYRVDQCLELTLDLDVQVISHSLVAGGLSSPPFEWPVIVLIFYEDMDGSSRVWTWGWYADPPGTGAVADPNETAVPAGVWTSHSFELMSQLINPRRIQKIRVGGSGHDFEGRVDNVRLTCSQTFNPLFIRGDADGNGVFNGLVDGLTIFSFQFIPGSPMPPCMEAADTDNDGVFNGLLDGVYVLNFNFVPGSPPMPQPYPLCGPDDDEALGCVTPPMVCMP